MSTHPNKKRKPTRRKKKGLSRLKTFAIFVLLGGAAALVFWRCFDDGDQDAADLQPKKSAVPKIEVKNGRIIDPTLVNEKILLKEEIPKEEENPKEEKAAIEPAPKTVDEEEKIEDSNAAVERFKLYAVAYHFHARIRSRPSAEATVIGYARRGATFRVGKKSSTKGCARGWHEVAPGNLFVCAGDGIMVSDEPVTFEPSPPAPNLEASLPYRYAYVNGDGTPEYWRIPAAEELKEVSTLFESMEDQGKQVSPELPDSIARSADGGAQDFSDLPEFVHQRMNKGYFVSLDGDEESGEEIKYKRTIRGRYIPADSLNPAGPSSFEGVLLGEISLPRVFVVSGGAKLLRQDKRGSSLKNGPTLSRLTDLPFLGELKHRARTYLQVGENQFLNPSAAVIAKVADPPQDLKPGERWIDIDLSEQTLVAYEGETPVFATLVSTGREGFETPVGEFRISSKHVSITMDDPNAGDEAYSIEDVPWTQYFQEGFALHAAFWHNRFGRVRSHGCVNLSPADARRLFFWTEPHVPAGFHGIISTRDNPGTRVVIHE